MRNNNTAPMGANNAKSSETILRTPNAFNVEESIVAKSGKGEWNDFEAFSNETKYSSPNITKEKMDAALKKAHRILGRAALIAMPR